MTRKVSQLFVLFLFFITPAFLFAGENNSLNSFIEEALNNNSQIQAAKFRYEAAKTRIRLLRSLQDPKFEYEYDKIIPSMIAGATGASMPPMRTFSISQEFPFPTKLFLRRSAAEIEAKAYEQEYKETERKVIKDVKETYSNLFLNSKKIQLTKENLSLLAQFVEVANKKYAVNKAGAQDSLRAQVEHSKLSNQLVLFEQEEIIARNMLDSILSRKPGSPPVIPEESIIKSLNIDEDKVISLAKENRPELKSYKEMVRKSEVDYSLAKQEYLPDFMLKYKREEKGGKAGSWAGTLGVSIPIWFWEKQDSFVREAKANVGVVKAEYKTEENLVLFEVRTSFAKFEAAKKLVEVYETGVLPQALAAVETSRRSYEADKISFLELLDSLRTLKDFQMEYFEARANMEIALADLERSVGVDLQSDSLLSGRKGEKI